MDEWSINGTFNRASNRTEQNRTEQNRTEQNRTEQNRTEQVSELKSVTWEFGWRPLWLLLLLLLLLLVWLVSFVEGGVDLAAGDGGYGLWLNG